MDNKLKAWAVVFLCLSLVFFIGKGLSYGRGGAGHNLDSMPGPMLLYPVTRDIDLKSQSFIEFKWQRTDAYLADYYDFRLYKGDLTTEANLLTKKQLSVDDYPFKFEASGLDLGQVYTWSLIQVYNDGRKSDESYGSFQIIKK